MESTAHDRLRIFLEHTHPLHFLIAPVPKKSVSQNVERCIGVRRREISRYRYWDRHTPANWRPQVTLHPKSGWIYFVSAESDT